MVTTFKITESVYQERKLGMRMSHPTIIRIQQYSGTSVYVRNWFHQVVFKPKCGCLYFYFF